MSCRCRDIRTCSRDLSILNSVLRQISRVSQAYGKLQNGQEQIWNREQQAYELDEYYRTMVHTKRLKNSEAGMQNMEECRKSTERMLSRLERERCNMEREDETYHLESEENN